MTPGKVALNILAAALQEALSTIDRELTEGAAAKLALAEMQKDKTDGN